MGGATGPLEAAREPEHPGRHRAGRRCEPIERAPAPGKQYYMVTVTLTDAGKGASAVFSAYSLSALGRFGRTYTAQDDDCGVVPKALDDFQKVRAVRRVSGNVCDDVLEEDAPALRLEHRSSPKSTPVFVKLR